MPLLFTAYGVAFAWYLAHGEPARDVARARRTRPWDTQKREPAYADMLGALRRELWAARLSTKAPRRAPFANLRRLLPLLSRAA